MTVRGRPPIHVDGFEAARRLAMDQGTQALEGPVRRAQIPETSMRAFHPTDATGPTGRARDQLRRSAAEEAYWEERGGDPERGREPAMPLATPVARWSRAWGERVREAAGGPGTDGR